MNKQFCYKCRKDVQPIDFKERGVSCPLCLTPIGNVRHEALRDDSDNHAVSLVESSIDLDESELETAFVDMGLSESAAKIAAKGREPGDTLAESFEDMGLSESAAKVAAKGREPGDTLAESFEDMGLSESAAKNAAKGRD